MLFMEKVLNVDRIFIWTVLEINLLSGLFFWTTDRAWRRDGIGLSGSSCSFFTMVTSRPFSLPLGYSRNKKKLQKHYILNSFNYFNPKQLFKITLTLSFSRVRIFFFFTFHFIYRKFFNRCNTLKYKDNYYKNIRESS